MNCVIIKGEKHAHTPFFTQTHSAEKNYYYFRRYYLYAEQRNHDGHDAAPRDPCRALRAPGNRPLHRRQLRRGLGGHPQEGSLHGGGQGVLRRPRHQRPGGPAQGQDQGRDCHPPAQHLRPDARVISA